jgi:5'-deoxynucleotidase YfbR-like HD superfamily hydrolase
MKSFIVTLIIGAVLVTGSVLYSHRLETEADKLSEITDSLKESVKSEDYKTATKHAEKLNKCLSDFEKFFLATGDHLEIDNIKINLAELKSFIKYEMQSDAMSKIYVLDFLFNHLPHNTKVRIGNIL